MQETGEPGATWQHAELGRRLSARLDAARRLREAAQRTEDAAWADFVNAASALSTEVPA
jgi:hypothetical protein